VEKAFVFVFDQDDVANAATLIPKSLEHKARQWVQNYQQAQELFDEICQIYWDKLADRDRSYFYSIDHYSKKCFAYQKRFLDHRFSHAAKNSTACGQKRFLNVSR